MTMSPSDGDMRQMTGRGRAIEDDSFAIIDREVGDHGLLAAEWQVVRRVIHATADFEFRELMALSGNAVQSGTLALRKGCPIVVDVKMIAVGLSAERLAAHGSDLHCFISDDDVIALAKQHDSTRAIEAMRKAHRLGLLDGAIVAIGNAPTALLELLRLARDEGARPALVVGVPVGFVSAAESKAALIDSALPFIASRGRKGGSTIAVAIVHALLYLLAHPPADGGSS
jgi:precorrin-8X/cobalt-precorrin-8 methylmutase